MVKDDSPRINTAHQGLPSPDRSARNRVLDRQQHLPNDPAEPAAAEQRLNDTGTEREPAGVDPDIAIADKEARTGGTRDRVRSTPPFGDWDETGPVSPIRSTVASGSGVSKDPAAAQAIPPESAPPQH